LLEKADGPDRTVSDIESLEMAREAADLAETRRTDLMSGLLNVYMQKGIAQEIGKINLGHIAEIQRLESAVVPFMIMDVNTLVLEHKSVQTSTLISEAGAAQAEIMKATAKGFKLVTGAAMTAKDSKLVAAESVASSAHDIMNTLEAYRAHEASYGERQQAAQEALVGAVAELANKANPTSGQTLGNKTKEKRPGSTTSTIPLITSTLQ